MADQRAFRAHVNDVTRRTFQTAIVIIIPLVVVTWPLDHWGYLLKGEPRLVAHVLEWRLVVVGAAAVYLVATQAVRRLQRFILVPITVMLCLMFGLWGHVVGRVGDLHTNFFYTFYLLPLATPAICFTLPQRALANFALLASSLIGYLATYPAFASDTYFPTVFAVFTGGFAISTLLGHSFYDLMRENFFGHRAVEQERLKSELFSHFDDIAEQHGLEKIKTIGDAYMVAAGVPINRADHAEAMAEFAMAIAHVAREVRGPDGRAFAMRIGIHTGPVVAGVIGVRKFSYDLWGDTVNTASRMESHGIPGSIQVSPSTYEKLKDAYHFERRGPIEIKGKGEMLTFLLLGRRREPAPSTS